VPTGRFGDLLELESPRARTGQQSSPVFNEEVVAAAPQAHDQTELLELLVQLLLQMWPLWIMLGLVYVCKELLGSPPQPRVRKRTTTSKSRQVSRHQSSARAVPASRTDGASPGPGGLREIDTMTGTAFERRLGELFKGLGYSVRHTGRLGDFGADLIIERGWRKTAVQAKLYSNRQVGLSAVREALGACGIYSCDSSMVVTNSTFTWRARKLAEANNVELWDRGKLVSLLDANRAGKTDVAPAPVFSHCTRCGTNVSARVRDYCVQHRHRFAGLIYCYEHQRDFSAGGRS
jgi:restriction system protein